MRFVLIHAGMSEESSTAKRADRIARGVRDLFGRLALSVHTSHDEPSDSAVSQPENDSPILDNFSESDIVETLRLRWPWTLPQTKKPRIGLGLLTLKRH